MTVYDYSVPKTDGTELSLADFKGRVMLIVNTALRLITSRLRRCMKNTMIRVLR